MGSLKGKTALITGAGGRFGIGRAIALRFAEDGADVAVNDVATSGKRAYLPELVSEIQSLGRRSIQIIADVSKADEVDNMVQLVVKELGSLDILVNNAGALAGRDRVPVVDLEEKEWDRIQTVNAKGVFLCCRSAARVMIKQGRGGKIVNVSSVSGKKGIARFAAYCASKFAVIGFSQALAIELAPHNVTVNSICPSLVNTERVDDMAAVLAPSGIHPGSHRETLVQRAVSNTPLGRMVLPEDAAGVASFLASGDSDFLTGLSITLAGGSYFD